MDNLARELKITEWTDWYRVKAQTISDHGGLSLLRNHQGSPAALVRSTYPQYPWKDWRFSHVPSNTWSLLENQRHFVEWMAKEILDVQHWTDWYKVTIQQIVDAGGGGLLQNHYGGSPSALLSKMYPEYPWKWWLFTRTSPGLWEKIENQREFIEWIGSSVLNVQHWEQWYDVSLDQIKANGGTALVTQFSGGGMAQLMRTMYPQYAWQAWRFGKKENNYWENTEHQLEFARWLSSEFGIDVARSNDWHRVSKAQIRSKGGGALWERFGSRTAFFRSLFPSEVATNNNNNSDHQVSRSFCVCFNFSVCLCLCDRF